MLRDFGQLPPVRNLPLYAKDLRDALSNDGIALYNLFKEVYKLDVIQRQSGNSHEQQNFRNLLLRLRDGKSIIEDWKTLSKRFESNVMRLERDRFKDAMFVSTKWEEVHTINNEKLRSLNVPVAKIIAVHTGGDEAKKANFETAHRLEAELLLARGARIMLTTNLWTAAGLVNGALGIIQDILYKEDQGPSFLPIVIFISFEKYTGPTIASTEGIEAVPIAPVQRSWEGKNGRLYTRMQVPIRLVWAITVHKSQGLTLDKAVIDNGNEEFAAGLSFVAISRVRKINDILLKPFDFKRLKQIQKCKRMEERVEEEQRLLKRRR